MKKKTLLKLLGLSLIVVPFAHIESHDVSAISKRTIVTTDMSESDIRTYYQSVNGKKGKALLTGLHDVLKDHTTYSYSSIWDAYKITDRDWIQSPMSNEDMTNYSFPESDDPFVRVLYRTDNFTSTAAHASNHANTQAWNFDREHVWPKSLGNFDTNAPAGTDLHHLMPGDKRNNSQGHNNYAWGNVDTLSAPNIGFADKNNLTGKRGVIIQNGVSYDVYEPQDCDKGDIARACFYMAARYSVYTSASDPFLELTDDLSKIKTFTATSTEPGNCGLLSDLLEWHKLDPVDSFERHRNNLVYYNFQHNRNPFIDFPDWVDIAFGNSSKTTNVSTDKVVVPVEFKDRENVPEDDDPVIPQKIVDFQSLNTYASLSVEYSKDTEISSAPAQYRMVNNVNGLIAGREYIIGGKKGETWYTMSNAEKASNRDGIEASLSDSLLSVSSGTPLTLMLFGSESSGWYFKTTNYAGTNGYLGPGSSETSKYLKPYANLSQSYATCDIAFTEEGDASIIFKNKTVNNVLQFNPSGTTPLFSSYSSTQEPVYLFIKNGGDSIEVDSYYPTKNAQDKYNISLNFGVSIPASVKQNLGATELGIAYKKGENGHYVYQPLTGCFCTSIMGTQEVDETIAEAITNNHYYQFVLGLFGIPETDWDVEVTACGYAIVDGETYLTNSKQYSVESIAMDYINNHSDDSAVNEHSAMLKWLFQRGY